MASRRTPVELAPEVEELLDWDRTLGSRLQGLTIPESRRVLRAAVDELAAHYRMTAPAVASVDEYEVPVDGASIRLRVYIPDQPGRHGVFFHIHGGGFTVGGIDWIVNHAKCATICARAGCIVSTVDYRLAPEFPFPAAPEDCYSALLWLVEQATPLGIDARRIVVGGESAGGNLAAAVALMARDRGGPQLALQVLEVPVADMSAGSTTRPSMRLYGDGYGLDTPAIHAFTDAYLPNPGDREEPYASPLCSPDLAAVAPAHIITAEYDPLRDGGEAYATRLEEAGITTTLRRFSGHTHGSGVLWQTWPPAGAWLDEVVEAIRHVTSA